MKSANLTKRIRNNVISYLFILPGMLSITIFLIVPIFYGLFLSFHSAPLYTSPTFSGLKNYIEVLRSDYFWISAKNTIIYSAIFIPSVVVSSLLIAIILNTKIRLRNLFRSLFFIPFISSVIVISVVWKWMYHYDLGIVNYLLGLIHIPPQVWLGDPRLALSAIAVMTIWRSMGFYMILYLAGLQSIPSQLYEAATVDGASHWHTFYHITLPLLRPTSVFVFIIATISSFQMFEEVYIMTFGGPANSTSTLGWLTYDVGFLQLRMGRASTIGFILFLFLFIMSLVELRVFKIKGEY